ncbi:hypothetical protein OSH11_13295 [Kaistia dalseonensis]|uniref:Uncharacterized protein n=1 Tax=Kaistia dalseonensis TaxID=410840 RepID=A0ABU0H948_9HYPH|nr:hypothetical protein [Kaistia dalseonensis]MCX5495684.1 hypothetical protein [Kaistia dalseonensis]MDQ0438280.1 hypothetical protein [Kaistia dalseonensis]
MAAFLRIVFLIPIGLIAAIVTAVVVYLAAFGFGGTDLWGGPENAVPVIMGPVVILLANIARYAPLPFLAAIFLSEVLAIRSLILWMLFGGALGLGLHLFGFPGNYALLPPLAAGFAAGFAYWLIAGRGAGSLRGAISRVPE